MAKATSKIACIKCGKERATSKCAGCSQDFCYNHLTDHRQELSQQLDDIEVNRDLFRETLNEQTIDLKKHPLIEEIDQWEDHSIRKIQQIAKECREQILHHTSEHIHQIEVNLIKLTDQLREIRQENDFNEIDLQQLKQSLSELTEELDQPSNVSIEHDSTTFVDRISVVISSRECVK
jgi:predicted nuclease with TOPRIM domain